MKLVPSALVAAVVGIASLAAQGQIAPGPQFESPQHGFSIRVPKDWAELAISPGEKRIIGSYLWKRDFQAKKDYWVHQPEMRIVASPKRTGTPAAESGGTKPEDPKKKIEKEITEKLGGGDYRDFIDYVDRELHGGHMVDKEEKQTID